MRNIFSFLSSIFTFEIAQKYEKFHIIIVF